MNSNLKVSGRSVSLFIPCLIDQVYPEIGFATANLIRHLGYKLIYNKDQTCCGQPAFNAGQRIEALRVAQEFIKIFRDADCIVAPSGSCIAMIRNYYPVLFEGHPLQETAIQMGEKAFELSEFLIKEAQSGKLHGSYPHTIGYHHSCHSYRELRLDQAPLKLLELQDEIVIKLPAGEPVCCGFGGLFSIKYDAIAAAMAFSKLKIFSDLNVQKIVTNDPGCLMHLRQEALDRQISIDIVHIAQVLEQALKLNTHERV